MAVIARCWIGQTLAGPVLVTEDQVEDYRQQHFQVDGPYVLADHLAGAVEENERLRKVAIQLQNRMLELRRELDDRNAS